MPGINRRKLKLFVFYTAYFLLLVFVYLAFISKGFHYDSISLAQWAENKQFYILGQQHHILLTLIYSLFYSLWAALFYSKNALIVLSGFQCFIGALAVTVFLITLNKLFENRLLALFGSLGLAFSLNYWHYSTLLETHIVPTAFLIIAIYYLVVSVRKGSLKDVFYAGFFSCLSLFSSGANIVFIPAFFVFLICSKSLDIRKKKQYFLRYAGTILLCWFIPFLIFGTGILLIKIYVKSRHFSFLDILKFYYYWFKGPLYWETFHTRNLLVMAESIVNSILVFKNALLGTIIFYVAAVFLSIRNRKILLKEHPDVFYFSLTAITLFLVTVLFYEPSNLQRYTPLLVFIWLIICLWVKSIFSKKNSMVIKIAIFSFTCFLFINNLTLFIAPAHREENNSNLQEALLLKEISGEKDIVITEGGQKWPSIRMAYIPYFAKREVISLKGLADLVTIDHPPQVVLLNLQKDIEAALNNGYNVFVLDDAFVLDSEEYKQTSPIFYSTVVSFLKSKYCVTEYRREKKGWGSIIIYRLAYTSL